MREHPCESRGSPSPRGIMNSRVRESCISITLHGVSEVIAGEPESLSMGMWSSEIAFIAKDHYDECKRFTIKLYFREEPDWMLGHIYKTFKSYKENDKK